MTDRYFDHQSKAGKVGGRAKSPKKIAAARANLMRARLRRRDPAAPLPPLPQALPPANQTQFDIIDDPDRAAAVIEYESGGA